MRDALVFIGEGQSRHCILYIYRKTSDRSTRLLSVQVSQIPGLYAGPGIYPGPGLYHNMSTFIFTGYQYFVYFHTKTPHIEKAQKRAIKFIIIISSEIFL